MINFCLSTGFNFLCFLFDKPSNTYTRRLYVDILDGQSKRKHFNANSVLLFTSPFPWGSIFHYDDVRVYSKKAMQFHQEDSGSFKCEIDTS